MVDGGHCFDPSLWTSICSPIVTITQVSDTGTEQAQSKSQGKLSTNSTLSSWSIFTHFYTQLQSVGLYIPWLLLKAVVVIVSRQCTKSQRMPLFCLQTDLCTWRLGNIAAMKNFLSDIFYNFDIKLAVCYCCLLTCILLLTQSQLRETQAKDRGIREKKN